MLSTLAGVGVGLFSHHCHGVRLPGVLCSKGWSKIKHAIAGEGRRFRLFGLEVCLCREQDPAPWRLLRALERLHTPVGHFVVNGTIALGWAAFVYFAFKQATGGHGRPCRPSFSRGYRLRVDDRSCAQALFDAAVAHVVGSSC